MIWHEMIGEFWGTMVLVVFGCGVCATVLLKDSKGENSGWIVVTTGWFLGVVLGVFVAQSAGSLKADINPAVTFAKFLLDSYTFVGMLQVMCAEFLGAFVGAFIVWCAYIPHFNATKDPLTKLNVFCTTPAIRNYPCNLLCEIIGTFILIIGVGALFGKATLGHPTTGLGPYLVGLLVWGIGISLGGPTGYAINPARDLSPRIMHALLPLKNKASSDWAYAWIPCLGPIIGATFGAFCWRFIF